MKNWLTSMFLLITLTFGVLAGTPLFSAHAENGMSAMECCKKKKMDCGSSETMSTAQLCCAINCGNPVPTSPGTSFNFAPSAIVVSDSILKQIALLLGTTKPIRTNTTGGERKTFRQKFQPKYIQHHSFLI